jgi:L-fuconate dehydratase
VSSQPTTITRLEVTDVRFPTSDELHGSDAMNTDPDYSASYVSLHTSSGSVGFGLAFTIGRGNDVQCAAIEALAPLVIGMSLDEMASDPALLSRTLLADSHLRWLGPEKGVIHMAIGAVVNAGWDLLAREQQLPLWKLLAQMQPEQLTACIDFRYITDALTPREALEIFTAASTGKAARIAELEAHGYPAYTTTPGWLGYDDDQLVRLSKEAVADGFTQIKLKVGASLDDDRRRVALARATVGPNVALALDANQRWDVDTAIEWVGALAEFDIAWIEEPTSPDDIVGHAAIARAVHPIPVATGEHCQNRIMFKQLLQLNGAQILQIDAARVAGVNENIAILALAAKFGVRVCPHAGGVGLCEMVRHLSFFDYAAVSTTQDDRMIEWVDHLHENFTDPATISNGRYTAPTMPGFSAQMHPESIEKFRFSQRSEELA